MNISIDVMPYKRFVQKLDWASRKSGELMSSELNRIADRHLARCKENTPVGVSPDSPTLRDRWDRSGVHLMADGAYTEIFNTARHAPFWEYGHRQTPGRVIFIELSPGQSLYGRPAKEVKKGKYAGKWGIYLKLKKSYVKGRYVMTDSEKLAQRELNAAARRILQTIGEALK